MKNSILSYLPKIPAVLSLRESLYKGFEDAIKTGVRCSLALALSGCVVIVPAQPVETRFEQMPTLAKAEFEILYSQLKTRWEEAAFKVKDFHKKTKEEQKNLLRYLSNVMQGSIDDFVVQYKEKTGFKEPSSRPIATGDYGNALHVSELQTILQKHDLIVQMLPVNLDGVKILLPRITGLVYTTAYQETPTMISSSVAAPNEYTSANYKKYMDLIDPREAVNKMREFLSFTGIHAPVRYWEMQFFYGTTDPASGAMAPFSHIADVGGMAQGGRGHMTVVIPAHESLKDNVTSTAAHEAFHNHAFLYEKEQSIARKDDLLWNEAGYPPKVTYTELNEGIAGLISEFVTIRNMSKYIALTHLKTASNASYPYSTHGLIPLALKRAYENFLRKEKAIGPLPSDFYEKEALLKRELLIAIVEEANLLGRYYFNQPNATVHFPLDFYDMQKEIENERRLLPPPAIAPPIDK